MSATLPLRTRFRLPAVKKDEHRLDVFCPTEETMIGTSAISRDLKCAPHREISRDQGNHPIAVHLVRPLLNAGELRPHGGLQQSETRRSVGGDDTRRIKNDGERIS